MQDLKSVIAKNIADLRRASSMTQIELATRLNYSDKAVSKWERGESLPDIATLKEIADLFSVKVDYLLTEDHSVAKPQDLAPVKRRNRLIITLLSVSLVWLIATFVFVCTGIALPGTGKLWLTFIYSVPVTAIVLLVFNTMWGRRSRNFLIISVLVWSMLLSVYLSVPGGLMWMIFLLGIPAQLIIVLWSRLGK